MSNHRSRRFIGLSSLASFLLLLPIVVAPAGAQTEEETEEPSCERFKEFDPTNFPAYPNIDNPWLPLVPGTQVVLEGTADRGTGTLPHRVIFTVTDLTKVIDGVRTRVMWDLDINEGRLSEAELAFFAQEVDEDPETLAGNVWNIGEYPEEYEEEVFMGAPSTWIHGIGDAEGGIHMKAVPEVSDVEYLQGSVPDIEFLDCAKVVNMTTEACVPAECHEPALVTHERSPLDPEGGIQTKFHAQGMGIVLIGFIDDPEGENLVLVERQHLSRDAMALVNRETLRLDKRAARVSAVYAQTPPIEPPRGSVALRSGGGSVALRATRGPEAQRAVARPRGGKGLQGGKAAWCVRALGRKLCRRWATTGSVLPD